MEGELPLPSHRTGARQLAPLAVRDERWKYIRTFDLEEPRRVAFEELENDHSR